MEETCKEEHIYWNCFKFTHFLQYLHAGFDRQLTIPEDFARNFRKKLAAETVHLKGPGGDTWSVGITDKDGTLFFNDGWSKFVESHSSALRENDVLFFKYDGYAHFDVLILDGQSNCERAASYFVRKSGQTQIANTECQTKRKTRESSVEISSTPSQSIDDYSPSEKDVDDDVNKKSRRAPTVSASSSRRFQRDKSSVKEVRGRSRVRRKVHARTYPTYESNRRLSTEDEKRKALRLAEAAFTPESFTIIMKPSHVYRVFLLNLPSWWIRKHLVPENQDVILRLDNKTWRVRFYWRPNCSAGRFSNGWMRFSVDNNLEEFDVCVFKPVNTATKPVTLGVLIFRAVNQITPLTPPACIQVQQPRVRQERLLSIP